MSQTLFKQSAKYLTVTFRLNPILQSLVRIQYVRKVLSETGAPRDIPSRVKP